MLLNLRRKNIVIEEEEEEAPEVTIPWIEKYRPKKLQDLVLDDGTMKKLQEMVNMLEIPNIILTGVPGVGKTSSILCVAKLLYGVHQKDAVVNYNASDSRAVRLIYDSITTFCKKRIDLSPIADRLFAQHKLVILDEADNMTPKAQQLIKSLMETYPTTRFALTCNNSSGVIESIQSRCIIIRFKRLDNELIKTRLAHICSVENVTFTDAGLTSIVEVAQGDLRKAVNALQITYTSFHKVVPETVNKLCDKPPPNSIAKIFIECYGKNFKKAFTILQALRDDGYSEQDLVTTMINTLKSSQFRNLTDDVKLMYLEKVCNTAVMINTGVNSPIQLTGCLASLCRKNAEK